MGTEVTLKKKKRRRMNPGVLDLNRRFLYKFVVNITVDTEVNINVYRCVYTQFVYTDVCIRM